MTEPQQFDWIPGWMYDTRYGRKAECVHVWEDGGALFVATDPDVAWSVRANGKCTGSETPDDIVAEWREPRQWTVYIYEREDKTCVPLFVGPAHVSANMSPLAKRRLTEGEGL